MTKTEKIIRNTHSILSGILDQDDFPHTINPISIYDIEYIKEAGEYYLRVYIDKNDGVSIKDCENVSKRLSPLLDKFDEGCNLFDDGYILEVCSPGLTRALRKDSHLRSAIGKLIDVTTYRPIKIPGAAHPAKAFTAELKAFDEEKIFVLIYDNATLTGEVALNRKDLAGIRLSFNQINV